MKILSALCALLAVLVFDPAIAEEQSQSGPIYLVPPEPINLRKPIFPENATGNEAWVHLTFTVKTDGTTTDIKATDGFYSKGFETVSINAAKAWTFKPATENGKPVEWILSIDIPFLYINLEAGAYPPFVLRYDEIEKHLANKDFATAKSLIVEAFDKGVVRLLYEYALTEIALYSAETGLGNPQAAYKAIRRSTPNIHVSERETVRPELGSKINKRVQIPRSGLLPLTNQRIALRYRFTAEANLGLYVDALETFDRLNKIDKLSADDEFVKQMKLIRAALDSAEPLAISGTIEDGGWYNRPARRTFTFADVQGKIDGLEVSCDRRIVRLPFQPDVDWTLPPSWGECDLEVTGDNGTRFTFIQFSPNPGQVSPTLAPQLWTVAPVSPQNTN